MSSIPFGWAFTGVVGLEVLAACVWFGPETVVDTAFRYAYQIAAWACLGRGWCG